jgi:LPS-assembly lipoprotein
LGLSACGFQLRGTGGADNAGRIEANVSPLYLTFNNRYGDLHKQLQTTLADYGVEEVGQRQEAEYALAVTAERHTRRAVATTRTISVSEYEIRLEVDMELTNRENEMLIPATTLATERIYTFDSGSLVGSGEEEAVLLEEMRVDIALQILRRINATVRTFEAAQSSESLSR